ncbi:MAG TPA: hypothetical protein VIU11_02100 [Nakamurella sp.]
MAAIYEFQVSGQIGSVIRSALPEMQTFEETCGARTFRGTAGGPQDIGRLLDLIRSLDLVVEELHIAARPDNSLVGDDNVPVVDDRGSQNNIL